MYFMNMKNFEHCATFGVAGNFTGHLEQAGEAIDFVNIKTAEANAPKALFPTFIPSGKVCTGATPAFLHEFPFDCEKIIYPENEKNIQLEPECAVLFNAVYENGIVKALEPVSFGASNDCSIRKEGAKKISLKKNWGSASKGISDNFIELDSFSAAGKINDYRIASFLVRGEEVYPYGEDSAVKDYSYIYEKLVNWIIEKLNNQKDEGPAEPVCEYLKDAGFPEQLLISIGATRYTDFGEHNYLQANDRSVVILYPASKYSFQQIQQIALEGSCNDKAVSVLNQRIVL